MASQITQEALAEAGRIAEATIRQVWVCECGGCLALYTSYQRGTHHVATVFGVGDFIIYDEEYV